MQPRPVFDPNTPSVARTYDYLLGGKDNYPVDREVGEIFIQRFPGAVQIALDNRACLVRAVTFIAGELGIGQFIDLGSGLPTADNVHQVAQRINAGGQGRLRGQRPHRPGARPRDAGGERATPRSWRPTSGIPRRSWPIPSCSA